MKRTSRCWRDHRRITHPATDLDSTAIVGVVGILASLGGVYLGAMMARQTARDLAQDAREWTERQAIRERQVEAVAKFDERLLGAMADCPRAQGPAKETAEAIEECRVKVVMAWARGTIIDDPEIVRRVRSLDMLMWIARDDGEMAEHRWSPARASKPQRSTLGRSRKPTASFVRHSPASSGESIPRRPRSRRQPNSSSLGRPRTCVTLSEPQYGTQHQADCLAQRKLLDRRRRR
jgi:hypothetical protein